MAWFGRIFTAVTVAWSGVVATLPAEAQTPVKFALDWTFEGSHAVFAQAVQGGTFQAAGLAVKIDRGYGSGDTINKVAAGAYDFGYANINTIPPFNAKNPGNKITCVFVVYDGILNSIIGRTAAGIQGPHDLVGKTIADTIDDDSRILFPVYARAVGLDPASVTWVTVAANLRDSMLAQKRVDSMGATSTALLAVEKYGLPADQLVVLSYSTALPDLLRSGIIVSEKTAKERPDLVRAFVGAVATAELQAIKDPVGASKAIAGFDGLIDVPLETARFRINLDQSILTANVRAHGLSYVTPARLAEDIRIVSQAYGIPIDSGAAADLYSDQFLPPRAALQVATGP